MATKSATSKTQSNLAQMYLEERGQRGHPGADWWTVEEFLERNPELNENVETISKWLRKQVAAGIVEYQTRRMPGKAGRTAFYREVG